ncbi:Stage V sporulation protein AC OS=Lysinibacillus sphaericus OX=1421 GN=LYSIN_02744 PE=4 SV=1 [Lysinibacillus sphaericus]
MGRRFFFFISFSFNLAEATAGNPTVATMVFFAMILTGFGLYKRIGQFAGAGSAVPVTGFGNAVISAAIEHQDLKV